MRNPSSSAQASLANPQPLEGVRPVTDWAQAQSHANFILVRPAAASGWAVVDATIRGESATHYSTLRYFLDDGATRIRVKQYYNDWWIPTVCDVSFRRPGHPAFVGEDVVYVGRDYRRNDGSCGHALGTAVEMSLESGTMDDGRWAGLWRSLEAVAPDMAAQARRTTFAARSYWNRWGRVNAPWDTTEISSLRWTAPTSQAMEEAAWAITADRWAPIPGTIDSLGSRLHPAHGRETQAVFRWPMNLMCSAWLRAFDQAGPSWRPLIDESEVNRPSWESITVGGTTVRRAGMDPSVGNWYYAWRDGDKAYELHLRARKGLDAAAADHALKGVL